MRLCWLYLWSVVSLSVVAVFGVWSDTPSHAQSESREERRARILALTSYFETLERFELYQDGSGTNLEYLDRNAFSQPDGNLNFEQRSDFFIGNGIFDRP